MPIQLIEMYLRQSPIFFPFFVGFFCMAPSSHSLQSEHAGCGFFDMEGWACRAASAGGSGMF